MGFCSKWRRWRAVSAALALSVGIAAAAPPSTAARTRQPSVRSVVRADSKTGKLIRTVVVAAPRPVLPEVIELRRATPGETLPTAEALPAVIEETAKKYDVDPLLVHSVIQVESAYRPNAVSHKGAQGLMQLMPATARRFGVRNAFDMRDNIEGGVRYLKYLDSLFPNDLRLTLAAYNAGEGAVWKYKNQVPPYRETEQYVQKVGMRYGKAVREAEKKRAPAAVETPAAIPTGPVYAHVEAYIGADGRLHLRTASSDRDRNDRIGTP